MNKQKQTHRYRGQSSDYQRGRGGGGVKWVKGINCMVTGRKLNFWWQGHCRIYRNRNIMLYM